MRIRRWRARGRRIGQKLQPLQQPRLRRNSARSSSRTERLAPDSGVNFSACLPQVAGSRINLPVDQVPRRRHNSPPTRGTSAGDSIRSRRRWGPYFSPLHRRRLGRRDQPLVEGMSRNDYVNFSACFSWQGRHQPVVHPLAPIRFPGDAHGPRPGDRRPGPSSFSVSSSVGVFFPRFPDHLDPTARPPSPPGAGPESRLSVSSSRARLRRQPLALLQGRRAPTGLARHPQARILTQAVGVGLVAPALPQQQESSPQQIRQRIADRTRVSRIVQPLGQPVDEAADISSRCPRAPVSALSNSGRVSRRRDRLNEGRICGIVSGMACSVVFVTP